MALLRAVIDVRSTPRELYDLLREVIVRAPSLSDGDIDRLTALADAVKAAEVVQRAPETAPPVVHSACGPCGSCFAPAGAPCFPSCELGMGMGG